jgi:hypothetical protein
VDGYGSVCLRRHSGYGEVNEAMPRKCSICDHDEHHALNVALVQRDAYRNIAKRYGVSIGALSRHAKDHLPEELLVKAYEATQRDDAEDLAGELLKVKVDVHRLKEKAEEEGDLRTALLGCDKALKALELQARVEQLIQTAPTLNIHLTPEWLELRAVIVAALEPYPHARDSVLRALENGGNGRA